MKKSIFQAATLFSLVIGFIPISCKKVELNKENSLPPFEQIAERADPSIDSMRTIVNQMMADYYALTDKSAVTFEWFYDYVPEEFRVDSQNWDLLVRDIIDFPTILRQDQDIYLFFDFLQSRYDVSNRMKFYVLNIYKTILDLSPNATESFIRQQNTDAQSSSLYTSDEKEQIGLFTEFLVTYLNFFFENGLPSGLTNGNVTYRGCEDDNKARAIGGIIGAVVGSILGISTNIFPGGGSAPGVIGGFIVGAGAGIVVAQLGCGGTTTGSMRYICTPPNGSFVRAVGCNLYDVYLTGGGMSITSYIWGTNTNCHPTTATTTYPVLRVSADDPNSIVVTPVAITCGGTTTSLTLSPTFYPSNVDNDFPPAVIIGSGPSTVGYNQTVIYYASSSSNMPHYTLSWTLPEGGGSILQSQDDWVKVTWWGTGSRKIRVTLTNTCTSATAIDEMNIQVNP